MSQSVIVMTCPEMGWDCVVDVFTGPQAILESSCNLEEETPSITLPEFEERLKKEGQFLLHWKPLTK